MRDYEDSELVDTEYVYQTEDGFVREDEVLEYFIKKNGLPKPVNEFEKNED